MSGALTPDTEQVYLRPVRSIGGLVMDVTIRENHTDELEITEHPVEHGAPVADHAYLKPAQLTIEAGVSDSRADNAVGGDKVSVAMYEALRKLQRSREPFDVVTGKRVYKNMLFTKLGVVTEGSSENALMLTMELQEVIIAHVTVVAVPRGLQKKRSTNATTDKGSAQVTKRSSALSQLFGRSG